MKKLFIILIVSFISSMSFADNDKEIKSNQFVISVNIEEQVINIKFNVDSNVQSIKIIDNNSDIIVESGATRGYQNSTIEIPISALDKGTYFIRIQTDSGIEIQRIIIS